MNRDKESNCLSRRAAITRASQAVAVIALAGIAPTAALAKAKAAKDDFFFQEEPGEGGKNCTGCINFTAKSTGKYGAESGDCGLLEGDVCTHCYCSGWTDKNSAGAKKAGT